jgi:hypothetical protein
MYALLIAIVFVLELFAIYQRFNSTSVFTSQSAVEEFRKKQADAQAAAAAASPTAQSQAAPPPAAAAPAAKTSKSSGQNAGQSAPQCDWVCSTNFTPPENGVYQYFQCGKTSGQCTGDPSEPTGTETIGPNQSRDFPRNGQRIITSTGARTWTNSHVYAQEHREEFDLAIDESGVFNSRYKVQVFFGPIEGGSEIKMQPPFRLNQFPASLGQAWNGSWTDSNRQGDGDYACKTVGKEELNIGGTKIRTWVVECRITLKGPENTGNVLIKFWVSPELRNTAQEMYDQSITSRTKGPYQGKWMATLSNVKPQR